MPEKHIRHGIVLKTERYADSSVTIQRAAEFLTDTGMFLRKAILRHVTKADDHLSTIFDRHFHGQKVPPSSPVFRITN